MFKQKIFFLSSIVLLASIALIYMNYKNTKNIRINGTMIKVEVVSDDATMQKGLGGRKDLCENCGMLFKFAKPEKYAFWMKDMHFALDIVWIDNAKIVYIEKNVSQTFAGLLIPDESADEVLEINAGKIDQWGIKIGDTVNF